MASHLRYNMPLVHVVYKNAENPKETFREIYLVTRGTSVNRYTTWHNIQVRKKGISTYSQISTTSTYLPRYRVIYDRILTFKSNTF